MPSATSARARGDQPTPARGVAVRGQRARVRLAPGALDEEPRRLAVGAALDRSAGRIGCGPADAELIERLRAHHALVQAVVHHDDGAVEAERVERVAVRYEPARRLVPPGAAHPARLWLARRLRSERARQLLAGARPGEIRPQRVQRRDRQVVVRVDEAGKERATDQVLAPRARVRREQRALADRGDASLLDHDDLGRHTPGVHGEDATSDESVRACHLRCLPFLTGEALAKSKVSRAPGRAAGGLTAPSAVPCSGACAPAAARDAGRGR